ncbi:TetR family transcriptional regulator [Duganella sp. FT94W]|uniref:TetR family transcriptional regulator n=1 Tax=Duganella lactea TaxID=2692173 RepID=A0ABW9V3I0_9BURK|nr:TetR/AcrR family transcriptional regulator [Duganella lactea]MYM33278.1 TetR family transcriptional regulator [Duganella lactea]
MELNNGFRLSNRNTLLDALESLIAENSVHDITLEKVAVHAGITRGGLIYHFKSKEALLMALVERMRQRVDAHCGDLAPEGRPPLKTFLIGRIDYAFAMPPKEKKTMANLLAAAATYPCLLGPVKAMYDSGIEALNGDGEAAGLVLSIWTALDGFILLEMLNIRHFSALERQQMKDCSFAR